MSNALQPVMLTALLLALPLLAADTPVPPKDMALVASEDCGLAGGQPGLREGLSWTITAEEAKGLTFTDDRWKTFNHGNSIVYRFQGLRPDAEYLVRVFSLNVVHPRRQHITAAGRELVAAYDLPLNQLTMKEIRIPREVARGGVLDLVCEKAGGVGALVSAIELWSDKRDLLGAPGAFMRLNFTAMPPGGALVTGIVRIHRAPWNLPPLAFNPDGAIVPKAQGKMHTAAGATAWMDLAKMPGFSSGTCSLVLYFPDATQGKLQFSRYPDEQMICREWDWTEPDGTRIVLSGIDSVLTFRDQERLNYLMTLEQTGGKLQPLTRAPLHFSNAWGYTTGGAAEYMVKVFRLLGLNSVVTTADARKYEDLYGWQSQAGQYAPPYYYPFDIPTAEAMYTNHYRPYFQSGQGKALSPNLGAYQVSDEPAELPLKYDYDPELLHRSFRDWLKAHGAAPEWFGQKSWDAVLPLLQGPKTLEERRLYYWSHHYQRYLTPRIFALACDAIRRCGPNPNASAYVALSGHAFYMPSRMPLDMFQLAQYPSVTPGISDWMNHGGWRWDSDQAVAFSVAPFNAGARRYGKDFGQPPITFPMMHCVSPDLLRSFTQLANQCKLVSYYNYGPSYEVTEGWWSGNSWCTFVVQRTCNMAAQVDDLLGPGVMRPSRVAMLYSMANELWWPESSLPDKRATFLGLSHEYYQPELVNEDHVAAGALQHYSALYVLDAFVPRATQDSILEWVKNGGLLWVSSESMVRDEYNELYDPLATVAGLKRTYPGSAPVGLRVLPVKGEATFAEHAVAGAGRPSAIDWPQARIRANYSDGMPAWLEKPLGKGKVVYVGHRAGVAYSQQAERPRGKPTVWSDVGRALLTTPLHEAKVSRELVLSAPLVMAMPLSTTGGTVVVLYNMSVGAQSNLTLTLKEPRKPLSVQMVDDQMRLVDLPFDYRDGKAVFKIKDLPWAGTMVAVRHSPAPADPRREQMRQTAEKGLASTDWQTLSAAAWFAGFFPEWKLAERLVPLLQHENWAVRRSAAEAVGQLKYQPALAALAAALEKDPDRHVKAELLLAMARLKAPKARELAVAWLAGTDPILTDAARRAR